MARSRDYWWSENPDEKYWIEIRWVEGLGTELRCPQADSAGKSNPWYDLVANVEPGDVVYHWNAEEHRFVGRSSVGGAPRIDSNGERVVPLRAFIPILAPITLNDLRQATTEIRKVQETLEDHFPSHSLYMPFQLPSDGLRMMSNYFTKLPAALVDTFFGLSGLAHSLTQFAPERRRRL